jgi:pimeloyl-ACP methyl ester carboxylesterase
MRPLKYELVRMRTEDGLELHGLLYEPDKRTQNALIHVHGWIGNFYENKFIEHIAQEVAKIGLVFLTFNNRGTGIITDLIKREKFRVEYVRIGGCLEKFEDCLIDIKTAIDFLNEKGYERIILQGHSLGCQKITFYKYKTKDDRVKGLIELAPVDDVEYVKRILGSRYEESLKIAKEMIEKGKVNEPVPKWMEFYPLLTIRKFLDVADPETYSGRIFDYSGKLEEIKNVNCQILAVFGSKDEYQLAPEEKLETLKKNVKNCDTILIKNAGHGFVGFESELSRLIGSWVGKCIL